MRRVVLLSGSPAARAAQPAHTPDGGGQRLPGAPGEFEVVDFRPVGGAWLLDGLWHKLGIDKAIGKVLGPRRFTTDVERVLFTMLANRALKPSSKLAAAEWASSDVAITGLQGMDEDQCYRAMDLLIDADTEAKLQEAVFFACADLQNLEVDLLFFDTTSTYFERDEPRTVRARSGFTGTTRTIGAICRRS